MPFSVVHSSAYRLRCA